MAHARKYGGLRSSSDRAAWPRQVTESIPNPINESDWLSRSIAIARILRNAGSKRIAHLHERECRTNH